MPELIKSSWRIPPLVREDIKMARTYIKCATCEAEIKVIASSRKEVNQKAAWYVSKGTVCPVCWKTEQDKKRAAELIVATEEAISEELPELQGSEKQIAWATTIRHKLLNNIQLAYENKAEKFYFAWSAIESLLGKDMLNQLDNEFASLGLNTFSERYNHKQEFLVQFLNSDRMLRALDSLQSKTSANWWIDNRDTRASALLVAEYNATEPTLDDTPTKIVADVKAEATVRPESPLTETVAEIHLAGHEVQVSFKEKVEDFRLLMHKLQFKWMHSYWGRSLSGNNGLPDDRIAEAGNAILNAGFIIRLFDPELRRRAIAAEFELEHTRWILRVTSGEYIGWFEIKWSREEDYYKVAKKLPRSRYSKPYVVVPPESFEEVLDFAQPLRHSLADCLTINQGSFFERILYLSRLVRLKTM